MANTQQAKRLGTEINMTEGNPFRLIFMFALPLIAGNALQQLYNMVDSVVVGRFVGITALAAVGAAFPVIFMLASLFMGLSSGATIMISQYYGANDSANLRKTIDTIYTAVIVGAVPLCILGIVFTKPILFLLNVPAEAADEAYIYLVILMGGLVGSLGYNINAGMLQGIGDSRTPLKFLAIACFINMGLDLLLVVVFGMGVAGVAIATVVAQVFSWLYGTFYINRHYPELKVRPFSFQFDKSIFKQIVRLGVPAGIQQALFSIGIIVMSRLVNDFGFVHAAAFNAANKLDTFAFLPIQSIAMSVTTYTGQNIGAGRQDRVRKGTQAAMLMAVGFALLGLLVMPAGPYLLRLFNDEPEVITAGMAVLVRLMPFYSLLAVQFVLNSVMRGAGEVFIPMIASIVSLWLARLPAAYWLAGRYGWENMNFCFVIGWVLGLCITVPYYFSGRWRNKSITRAGSRTGDESADGDAEDSTATVLE